MSVRVILVCFDGSADARAAIAAAGGMFAGERATVLSVWEGFADVMARSSGGMGFAGGAADGPEIDATAERAADAAAEEGAELARQAGLDAGPRIARARLSIAQTILEQADAIAADAIVLGTRGLRGIRSALLGSVSNAVLHHADRPVVVVPSRELGAERRKHWPG